MHNPSYDVFDPGGALLREGRWHSTADPVLYAAENISLAALESLIYSGGKKMPPKTITTISFPDDLSVESIPWMDKPASQDYGHSWAREKRSVLLKVPSIAADKMEFNFVINPGHPDFKRLQEESSRPFQFDSRFIYLP